MQDENLVRKPRIGMLVYARNEERYLPKTLSAVDRQTLRPSRCILVDDGSEDLTSRIAIDHGWRVVVLKDRGSSAISTAELANVVNAGLEALEGFDLDYIHIMGADDVLPESYLEQLAGRMDSDPRLVVAGGRSSLDRPGGLYPRGVRMVRRSFWNPPRYPVIPGWEAYLVFRAMKEGYRVAKFDDIVFYPQRPPGTRWNWEALGRSMRVLGYHPIWVSGRLVRTAVRSPSSAGQMMKGYLSERTRSDVADWVRRHQRNRILRHKGT